MGFLFINGTLMGRLHSHRLQSATKLTGWLSPSLQSLNILFESIMTCGWEKKRGIFKKLSKAALELQSTEESPRTFADHAEDSVQTLEILEFSIQINS